MASDKELIDMAEMWPRTYATWCLSDPSWNADQHYRVARKLYERVVDGTSMRSWIEDQERRAGQLR